MYVKVCLSIACALFCLSLGGGQGYGEVQDQSTLVDLLARPTAPEGLEDYQELWDEPTIVLFGAQWCVFCPRQKKIIGSLEKAGYRTATFDADKNPKLYQHLKGKTTGLPLTVIFVKGVVVKKFVGITSAAKIEKAAKECKINEKT